MIAGPSEVVVLANSSADPRFIAADLLAQAEHDEAAQSILITDDARLGREVAKAVEEPARRSAEGENRRRKLARLWRDHCDAEPRRGRAVGRPPRARTSGDHGARRRCAERGASTTPARFSSANTRPKRSATMSAAPITFCRPRARPAFRPALACSIFSSARRCCVATRARSKFSGPRRSRSAMPKGWRPMRARSRCALSAASKS